MALFARISLLLYSAVRVGSAASPRKSIQFQNVGSHAADIYWNGGGGAGKVLTYPNVDPDSIETGSAFIGHEFFVTKPGETEQVGSSVKIDEASAVIQFELDGGTVTWKKSPTPIPVVSMPARFRNRRNDVLEQYWISGSNWVYQGLTQPKDESGQNVYTTHKFAFCKKRDLENCKKSPLKVFTIRAGKFIYTVPSNEPDEKFEKYAKEEAEFTAKYYKDTGRHWQAIYPRDKPLHPLWPADHVGQTHSVKTPFRKGLCDTSVGAKLVGDSAGHHIEMRRRMLAPSGFGGNENAEELPPSLRGALNGEKSDLDELPQQEVTLEVLCKSPRVFKISNFLDDSEIETIIEKGSKHIHRSTTGGIVQSTRTSKTAWVHRDSKNCVLENLYRRVADTLRINHKELSENAEDIQLVHYDPGQKYDPHYDWGVGRNMNCRYATLLLYLNDQQDPGAGGTTSFPKANLTVHPGKGSAILFYDILDDGNVDDMSLHGADPVIRGEKWLANFWVWDPKKGM